VNRDLFVPSDRLVRLAAAYYDYTAEQTAYLLNANAQPYVPERYGREVKKWDRVSIQADQMVEEEIARFLPLQDTVTMLEKLVRQAIEVRKLQKTYFRTRLTVDLAASKAAEKAFDDAAALFLSPPLETLI
jgi:hypothetical protein